MADDVLIQGKTYPWLVDEDGNAYVILKADETVNKEMLFHKDDLLRGILTELKILNRYMAEGFDNEITEEDVL